MADCVPAEVKAKWPREFYVEQVRAAGSIIVTEYYGSGYERLRDNGSALPAPIYRVKTHG